MPDLINTVVIIPIINALELFKNIQSDLTKSHIPLLMFYATALVQDKLSGTNSGVDIYTIKPFNMDMLQSSLCLLIIIKQIVFDKFYKELTNNTIENKATLENDFIQKGLNYIYENISEPDLSVEVLAFKVFLSRSLLYCKVKTLAGISDNELIIHVRIDKVGEFIHLGNNNSNKVGRKLGFSSSFCFSKF